MADNNLLVNWPGLQIYSNGYIDRSGFEWPDPPYQDDVIIKDIRFNNEFDLNMRFYKPNTNSNERLPIIMFLHGGGFCIGSRTSPQFSHNCCVRLAYNLNAIVAAPDYRLAPEHRLPAAVEDVVDALKWLKRQAIRGNRSREEWLNEAADYSRVFIVGDSSGGNIAHHLAVQFSPGSNEIHPIWVRGYILLAPFFGGVRRTRSERSCSEEMLTIETLDTFWNLSLPINATRDHPSANPLGPESPNLANIPLDPILVIVGGRELLKDRVEKYATTLQGMNKPVLYYEVPGEQHGFFSQHDQNYTDTHPNVTELIRQFMSNAN